MKVKVEHTPLPWSTDGFLIENNKIDTVIGELHDVGTDTEREANASLIARAVNNHYELLEACRESLEFINRATPKIVLDVKDSLRLAITNAEKEG